MTNKLATLILLLIAVNSMAQTDAKTRNYEVDDFDKIIIHGGGNLQIRHSDKHSLKVTNYCDETVNVSVSSKTLFIRVKDSGVHGCALKIEVGVHSLIELVQNGGGNVVLKGRFNPQNSFKCEVNGGGSIDFSELSVNSFYASIEGGGVILLHAEKELEGNISGGGIIKYTGDPKVKSNVSGGGAINKI